MKKDVFIKNATKTRLLIKFSCEEILFQNEYIYDAYKYRIRSFISRRRIRNLEKRHLWNIPVIFEHILLGRGQKNKKAPKKGHF